MSADKRSVTTDALHSLGMIHWQEEKRDAIHLGVEPVVAGEDIAVGANIGIDKDGFAYATDYRTDIKPVGISDPFLKERIQKGESFWLVVYPRQITSLRHCWEHPDFDNTEEPKVLDISEISSDDLMVEIQRRLATNNVVQTVQEPSQDATEAAKKSKAWQWIHNYADGLGLDVDELMEYADMWVSSERRGGYGEYLCKGGDLEGEYVSDEFWDNYDIVRDERTDNERGSFFTCSC
ncbi:hypothetical protein GAP32_492 [Cronobacter phage vB_CsaM_GAP32]|uniref:Uncharacterized protein n=1 Tax=Cronobacter phage vB_CsaM_GAP32 TaxID=1141136 RepID=K4F6P6_9CAUD|nr:hypothetical protein GAP32_492 [Cronobacter phage vB_CsaM_GAP32]AFC21951.1 hypothetical protein GAP32_492 [Cronobacter phage vB_CsaM_GAP32]